MLFYVETPIGNCQKTLRNTYGIGAWLVRYTISVTFKPVFTIIQKKLIVYYQKKKVVYYKLKVYFWPLKFKIVFILVL